MTDRDTILAMLTKASVPFTVSDPWDDLGWHNEHLPPDAPELPAGTSIIEAPKWEAAHADQPHRGGYPSMYAIFVFGPDGNMLALWAEE